MDPTRIQTLPINMARGIILIIATMFIVSIQDVVFKLFSSQSPLGQIFALRAIIALPLLLLLAWMQGLHKGIWKDALLPCTLLRSTCMTLMFLAFYAAIPFVSLSVLAAGGYMAPIFVALLSAFAIREAVTERGWIAVLVGFIGVLILLRPGTDAFSFWALLPILGAVFYAIAHILTRSKCQSLSLASMALSLNMVMMSAGFLVSAVVLMGQPSAELANTNPYLLGGWVSLQTNEWMILGLLAILAIAASMGIAGAYQAAPASIVATFEYCYLVFAAGWDLLFFGAVLSIWVVLGMALIVIAGLMVMRR